jgi:CelD/BcsL family acetyltransferase involved in cellulose biosynthesis
VTRCAAGELAAGAATVFATDPLSDPRWTELLAGHPQASVFHSVNWLRALTATYRYRPLAFTTSPPDRPLSNALLVCVVRSRLTGSRLVSLPFSDHCEPLVNDAPELATLLREAVARLAAERCRHLEVRPRRCASVPDLSPSAQFWLHCLDLRLSADEVFRGFHRDSIQRQIRKAERGGLDCRTGNSEDLLRQFFRLLVRTRRRHGVPPPPLEWFRALAANFGRDLQVRIAFKDGMPLASIVTLTFKRGMVYKYGASDERFHKYAATPLLFWQAIQEAKAAGLEELDLGRSDLDNEGLITFKDKWGAERTALQYWRTGNPGVRSGPPLSGLLGKCFGYLPDSLLELSGRWLYRHIG